MILFIGGLFIGMSFGIAVMAIYQLESVKTYEWKEKVIHKGMRLHEYYLFRYRNEAF